MIKALKDWCPFDEYIQQRAQLDRHYTYYQNQNQDLFRGTSSSSTTTTIVKSVMDDGEWLRSNSSRGRGKKRGRAYSSVTRAYGGNRNYYNS